MTVSAFSGYCGGGVPSFPVTALAPEDLHNGIVVRMPNWLGDAVMALPALYQLRSLLPEHGALGVITPASLTAFYQAMPWVDVILPLASPHRMWSSDERWMVRRSAFGAGVLFNHSLRDALMMRLCRIPRLYGAAARGRSLLLTRHFDFPERRNTWNHAPFPARYLSMVQALGAPAWDGRMPEIIPGPGSELPDAWRAVADSPRLLVLGAGASYGAAKRWGSGSYHEVARQWIAAGGVAAMVGSPSEAGIGAEIGTGLPEDAYFNLAGKTTLPQLMRLLKQAKAAVANDSGVMHLAAALGCPGVAVYGPTDHTSTAPIGAHWRILTAQADCAPCFKRVCPRGDAVCMKAVTAADVVTALEELLSES